jgi:hypothetical protein
MSKAHFTTRIGRRPTTPAASTPEAIALFGLPRRLQRFAVRRGDLPSTLPEASRTSLAMAACRIGAEGGVRRGLSISFFPALFPRSGQGEKPRTVQDIRELAARLRDEADDSFGVRACALQLVTVMRAGGVKAPDKPAEAASEAPEPADPSSEALLEAAAQLDRLAGLIETCLALLTSLALLAALAALAARLADAPAAPAVSDGTTGRAPPGAGRETRPRPAATRVAASASSKEDGDAVAVLPLGALLAAA